MMGAEEIDLMVEMAVWTKVRSVEPSGVGGVGTQTKKRWQAFKSES